jgi:hypothetical protein
VRVPKKGMLCGYCKHPVIRHMQAIEEFVPDGREGADPARLRKQLYHKKKCWSKELRHRLDTARADSRLVRSLELAKKSLAEAGGPGAIGRGEMSEEQLVTLAIREVGRQKPQLVSERARLITIGEDLELPDELIAAEDEEGQPSATFEVEVPPVPVKKPLIPRGQLQLAVKTAIEARTGSWWTREQIREDVKMLGLETTVETIDTTLWGLGKTLALERRRIGTGRATKLCEYRIMQPLVVPPMLDIPSEKVERPQKVRHSTRPLPWVREMVERGQAAQAEADAILAAHAQKEEQAMVAEQTGNGELSPRVKQAMFVLKSEKMLSELERAMMQLVQETIKSAREQIARLVEEELG